MSPPLLLPGGPRAAYALVCNLRSSRPSSVKNCAYPFLNVTSHLYSDMTEPARLQDRHDSLLGKCST